MHQEPSGEWIVAYTTIDNPELFFQTALWNGTGSALSVTLPGSVDMQPDWVWVKNRDLNSDHRVTDSVRGTSAHLVPNGSDAEDNSSTALTAFNSDGFSVGSEQSYSRSGDTHVGWAWKAGTTSGLSGGNITPSAYSFSVTAGFGIYAYTGNGSSDQTIPHGLGKKPQMIFYKRRNSGTNWVAQSNLLGNRVQLVLNGDDAQNTDSRLGASDDWSTTIFNVGTYGDMNSSGDTHVAYVFCNIKGYSRIGTYTGNGNADGTYVHLGFKPAWVMTKYYSGSGHGWHMQDNKRDGFNYNNHRLFANTNGSEETSVRMDLLSNGFKYRDNDGNGNNFKYIYMAFAESPFVNSNGIPNNAR